MKKLLLLSFVMGYLFSPVWSQGAPTATSESENKTVKKSELSGDGFLDDGKTDDETKDFETNIYGKKDSKINQQLITEDFLLKNNPRLPFSEEPPRTVVKDLFTADPNLIYYKIDAQFPKTHLGELIYARGNIKAYFIVSLKDTVSNAGVDFLRYGFYPQGDKLSGLERRDVLIYGYFRGVQKLQEDPLVKDVFIVSRLSVAGYYSLVFHPMEDAVGVNFTFPLPHTTPGHYLQKISSSFEGYNAENIQSISESKDEKKVMTNLKKNERFAFISKVQYLLNLEELLENDILTVGGMQLGMYRKFMEKDTEHQEFLQFGQKVNDFPFLDSFALSVTPKDSIAKVWLKISKILDQALIYDFKKRHDFFIGNIVYSDIRDMYMTAGDLIKKRIGACPERSSLEAAMFRKVGIATRLKTRLYHIYVEVYIPSRGWVSTSSLLREIPIVHSNDREQSYFIDWDQKVPLKVKWKGNLTPVIAF